MSSAAAILLGIAVLCSSSAAAQAPAEDGAAHDEEARARFQAGERAFARGDFEAALDDFERAYALSRRPGLLYNVGLAAQRARRRERAIEAFREYLRLEPGTANRASVERTIADLEELVAAERRGEPAPEPGEETGVAGPESSVAPGGEPDATPPEVTPRDDGGPGAAPIVLLAAGSAIAIGGVVLFVAAGSAASDVEEAQAGTPWSDVESSYDSAGTLSTIGGIALGVGVVTAAVGVVLLATSGGSEEPSASLRVGPGTIALAGSFQ